MGKLIMRVGHGYDVHAFEEGKPLLLGGVLIDYPKGLKAHSDGDVVIHALCDALLGASGLGDIGQHFPDNDPRLRLIDSRILLRKVKNLLDAETYRISNVDITIIAEEPKLNPYKSAMQQNLAADLDLTVKQVNVKATTNEKLGFIGRGEGIASVAIAIIYSPYP